MDVFSSFEMQLDEELFIEFSNVYQFTELQGDFFFPKMRLNAFQYISNMDMHGCFIINTNRKVKPNKCLDFGLVYLPVKMYETYTI